MAAPAPTGCFKCGRPGHWSRDCPANPTTNPNPNTSAPYPRPPKSAAEGEEGTGGQLQQNQKTTKKKKERATRPKLTPDLLLSDDGLGFVLRYFPKAFKPRARPGCEVEDLGNLIKLYTDWHSRLIPYYSFDQFVRKVEKVGASNRVRKCISELRERVARGGDPTQLHEPPVEEVIPEGEPDGTAADDPFWGTEAPLADNHGTDIDPPVELESNDVDPMQEDLLNEIYEKAADEPQIPAGEGTTEEAPPQALASKEVDSPYEEPPREAEKNQDGAASGGTKPAKAELTDEQRARMEANRLKALERAAARARASQPT